MFKKKSFYIVIGIVILIAVGAWYFNGQAAKKKEAAMAASLITVGSGDMTEKVNGTGTISANETMTVTALIGGAVTSAPFEEGDTVAAGTLLYTLDSKDLEQQIRAAQIAIEKANEAYRQSMAAQRDLTVSAAFNGKVEKLYVAKGDFVAPGTKLADVIDNSRLLLRIPFNAADMDKIAVGASANITLVSNSASLGGTVSRIYETVQSLPGYKAVRYIEISVTNPGAIGKGEKAYATVGGVGCNSAGEFLNLTEKSIVSAGTGQITALHIAEGDQIRMGALVAELKNDAIANAVSTGGLAVKDAQNALSSLQEKLSDYRITAPMGGKVMTKTVKKGDNVAPSAPMMTLSDTNTLYIDVEVDEVYISKITVGQKAEITAEALPDQTFAGEVVRINDVGVAKNGVTYYYVRVRPAFDERLKIAMNTTVDIIVGEKQNAVLVPKAAVSGDTVMVFADGQLKATKVETGIKDGEHIEVVSGLNVGDQIAGKQ